MRKLLLLIKQRLCNHEKKVENLNSRIVNGERVVFTDCIKCGKRLEASCGIYIKGRFV